MVRSLILRILRATQGAKISWIPTHTSFFIIRGYISFLKIHIKCIKNVWKKVCLVLYSSYNFKTAGEQVSQTKILKIRMRTNGAVKTNTKTENNYLNHTLICYKACQEVLHVIAANIYF